MENCSTTEVGLEYPPVLTKRDFVCRYKNGEFGNASPTWNNLAEWATSSGWWYGSHFHIRNRVAGGPTYYNVFCGGLKFAWNELLRKGMKETDLYISAMAPSEKTILQGEVTQSAENSIELFYTTVAKPMREALAEKSERAVGITAVNLLKCNLCPNSYEWLQILLERYPNHVVEFSTYSCCWGTLPNFNTVTWEVRAY